MLSVFYIEVVLLLIFVALCITLDMSGSLPCYHLYASPTRFTGGETLNNPMAIADDLTSSRLAIEATLVALNLSVPDTSSHSSDRNVGSNNTQIVRCVVICAKNCTKQAQMFRVHANSKAVFRTIAAECVCVLFCLFVRYVRSK